MVPCSVLLDPHGMGPPDQPPDCQFTRYLHHFGALASNSHTICSTLEPHAPHLQFICATSEPQLLCTIYYVP